MARTTPADTADAAAKIVSDAASDAAKLVSGAASDAAKIVSDAAASLKPISVDQLPGEVKALLRHDGEGRGNWNSWSEHVLSELDRLNTNYEKLRTDTSEQITQLRIDSASLQTKSGLWGIAGALSTIVLGAILYFSTEGIRPSHQAEPVPVTSHPDPTGRYIPIPGQTGLFMRVWSQGP